MKISKFPNPYDAHADHIHIHLMEFFLYLLISFYNGGGDEGIYYNLKKKLTSANVFSSNSDGHSLLLLPVDSMMAVTLDILFGHSLSSSFLNVLNLILVSFSIGFSSYSLSSSSFVCLKIGIRFKS
ncbi:hypothetical protein DERP_002374 [Dermatophagoides pteronyssinus]|uniref:Uncharacterized protein n=1 Tax=Dermatophagoides pteronyssinus TaxID=6956 RepID=A0ABQ8JI16_DERPT|nr:hypothetical protein DERP_002374 [Dermatophagoides pteronyssinus]